MTAAETKAAAEVMLAWADGKAVQSRCRGLDRVGGEWRDLMAPQVPGPNSPTQMLWMFDQYEYRIKLQPREWWVVRAPSYGDVVVSSEESAKEHARNYCRTNAEIIHVREVI